MIDPKKHDALWCMGNAYTATAFLIPEETEAKYNFDLATQFFQQAVDEVLFVFHSEPMLTLIKAFWCCCCGFEYFV